MNPNEGTSTGGNINFIAGDKIKNVWACNVQMEIATICKLMRKDTYVALNVVYPGEVACPTGFFNHISDHSYHIIKSNVDVLNIIQFGITLFDNGGNLVDGPFTTWQFNFKFDLSKDMFPRSGIESLMKSKINFKKLKEEGIDPRQFAELVLHSGMLFNDQLTWITFESNFDFGFLIKMLINSKLPEQKVKFLELLSSYFRKVYDVRFLTKHLDSFANGLPEVAYKLNIPIIGDKNQAGSNSILTGMSFFQIKYLYFNGIINDDKYCGSIMNLTTDKENV